MILASDKNIGKEHDPLFDFDYYSILKLLYVLCITLLIFLFILWVHPLMIL
jgi:hypothetical protein